MLSELIEVYEADYGTIKIFEELVSFNKGKKAPHYHFLKCYLVYRFLKISLRAFTPKFLFSCMSHLANISPVHGLNSK